MSIAVANNKGGTGKTVLTQCLAAAKVKSGNKVLIIDMDPDSNLTIACGLVPGDDDFNGRNVCDLFDKDADPFDSCFVIPSCKNNNFVIVPGHPELSYFDTQPEKAVIFKKSIETLSSYFDYIFVDCGPTLNTLLVTPLLACDEVLLVVKPETLSYHGLSRVKGIIKTIQTPEPGHMNNPNLKVAGVVVNMFRSVLNEHKEYVKRIKSEEDNYLGTISQSGKVTKAMWESGRPCVFAFPTSEVSKQFIEIAKKL